MDSLIHRQREREREKERETEREREIEIEREIGGKSEKQKGLKEIKWPKSFEFLFNSHTKIISSKICSVNERKIYL